MGQNAVDAACSSRAAGAVGRRRHTTRRKIKRSVTISLLAVLVAILLRIVIFGMPEASLFQVGYACLAAFASSLIGVLLIENVNRYPGVERASAIVPSFALAYGLIAIGLLMFKLDYSRFVLIGSFVAVVLLSYLEHFRYKDELVLRISVLAQPDGAALPQLPSIDWLKHSDHAGFDHADAIAVDFRLPLTDRQSEMLADAALAGIPVYNLRHLIESVTGEVTLEHISETAYGSLTPSPVYQTIKHVLDRMIALVVLIPLLPFLFLAGIAIKLDSPGPMIFRQSRMGYRAQPFTVYKFRTMQHGTAPPPAGLDDLVTTDADARVTRIGRIFRRTRVDELPQIVNILLGQMSWIGPRPEAEKLSRWYEEEIPYYRYRHVVRPGISGWAQTVQGHVADVDSVSTKLNHDFFYIKNFSLWLDLLILAKTLRVMVSGFGSK